ncbi:MAG: fasciclin domain-containing protein, partial [Saprospiraceae bacterium]|nr:fasciclin domain-containing protein [Saprospiraceae bacterium]
VLYGLFLALSATFLLNACKDDDDDPKNIVELAQGDANLSTLVRALERTDLVGVLNGTDQFTVFAPTNAAFSALFTALSTPGNAVTVENINAAVLKRTLLYHVVSGEVKSSAITTGYVKSAATFGTTTNPLSLYIEKGSGVKINGSVNVTTADVDASNGVIHVVDKVITLPTVVNHALNNPNFTSLVAALTRADLGVDYVTTLSGAGPFTVFAPTNAAFAALLTELNLASLNDIPVATLNAVLQYHVLDMRNVVAAQLTEGEEEAALSGKKFTIKLAGGAKILDGQGRTSNIVITDVQADNGVVHAIDKVLLPN